MNAIKKLLAAVKDYFVSGKAQKDFQTIEEVVFEVAPYISQALAIANAASGGKIPAGVINIVSKYPALFDGSIVTADERNLYTLGIATELVKDAFPHLDTTMARTAIQLAYVGARK